MQLAIRTDTADADTQAYYKRKRKLDDTQERTSSYGESYDNCVIEVER
jgi:hypothetical protein